MAIFSHDPLARRGVIVKAAARSAVNGDDEMLEFHTTILAQGMLNLLNESKGNVPPEMLAAGLFRLAFIAAKGEGQQAGMRECLRIINQARE